MSLLSLMYLLLLCHCHHIFRISDQLFRIRLLDRISEVSGVKTFDGLMPLRMIIEKLLTIILTSL